MKRAWIWLGGLTVLALLAGTLWAAYTRDLSGDGQKALLVALEYLISDGISANAGTDLDTSALALDASVDGLEGGLGTATTAAVDGDAAGSVVAHLRGINKKLAGNVAVTEGSGATIATNTGTLAGAATTFQVPVAINQAAAGRTTILALEAAKVIYLHALVGTMDVAGTVIIYYDDDGAGTNEVALTGNMAFAATGGVVIPFTANTNGCLRTASGKQLTIVTTGGAFDGYAIVSKK